MSSSIEKIHTAEARKARSRIFDGLIIIVRQLTRKVLTHEICNVTLSDGVWKYCWKSIFQFHLTLDEALLSE